MQISRKRFSGAKTLPIPKLGIRNSPLRSSLWLVLVPVVLVALLAGGWLLTRSITFAGMVWDETSGQPLSGVMVHIGSETTVTDEQGKWQVPVPRRTHAVYFSAPGFLSYILDVSPAALAPRMGGLDAPLVPARAWGFVQDELTGEPVEGARVQGGEFDIGTDASGQFALNHLPGGKMTFSVSVPGFYTSSIRLADVPMAAEGPLMVILRPVILLGEVVDSVTGEPVADVSVRLGDAVVTTGNEGRFQFSYVIGVGAVAVTGEGYGAEFVPFDQQTHLDGGQVLRIALEPSQLAGQVVDSRTEKPVVGARVHAGTQVAVTDEEGRYSLRSVPNPVTLQVEAAGYASVEAAYSGQDRMDFRLTARFTAIQVADSVLGGPLPGVQIGSPRGESVTDEYGDAALPLLQIGEMVTATRSGYMEVAQVYDGQSPLSFALKPIGLTAQVRDGETGEPLEGAWILANDTLVQADDSGWFRLNFVPTGPMSIRLAGYRKAAIGEATGLHDNLILRSVECPEGADPPCKETFLTPFHARGIYVPFGLLHAPQQWQEILDMVGQSPLLNSITLDVKGDRGRLAWDSQVPLAKQIGAPLETSTDLKELVADAHRRGIYVVARMVIFKDHPLATNVPDWAVRRSDGSVWIDGESLAWANPFLPAVWDYNVALAGEIAALGFDEIQMDYVRFPSDGYVGQIVYAQENTEETRTASIREFTRRMGQATRMMGVFTSADVFGLTVWVSPETGMGIGQRVIDIAPNVDYLAPMVYPQTFGPGNAGYAEPWKWPYEIVHGSVTNAQERVPPTTRIRPWLQGYGCCGRGGHSLAEKMIQRLAAFHADAAGWTYWNAGGQYDLELFGPFLTLEELQAQVAAVTGR